MHKEDLSHWHHDHTFDQDQRRPGESRTRIVILITALMMVVEIVAGLRYGSMALLADGLHMASHAVALAIAAFAYYYARQHARNPRYSFGTGKVNALGGFTGAVLLAIFALYMVLESLSRLINPVEIAFNQAIAVAVIGLVVNGISAVILGVDHDHGHGHSHGHAHGPGQAFAHDHDHEHHHQHDHDHEHHPHHQGQDHNLTSAYLHVLADALTSVLAIFALLAAKFFGFVWMDPVMGVVGAVLVARWSYGLLKSTSAILLDQQAPEALSESIRQSVEHDGDSRITDLHIWSIGPGIFSAQIALVAHHPLTPDEYKARLPATAGLVHVAVEVHLCQSH